MRTRSAAAIIAVAAVVVLALWSDRDATARHAPARGTRPDVARSKSDVREDPPTSAVTWPTEERVVRPRDLVDGALVDGIEILVAGEARPDAPAPWSVAWPPADDDTVWVWRPVAIRGVVRVEGPRPVDFSFDAVALSGRHGGLPADGGVPSPAPWEPFWLRRHGVPSTVELGAPGPDGRFEVSLPRVRGYGIRARARGWRTAWRFLDIDAATEELAVELVLRPSLHVRGVVRGPKGPVRDATVAVYVVRRGRYREHSLSSLYIELEGGFTGTWDENGDRTRVTASYGARTAHDGTYDVEVTTEGETWIVVRAPGLAPADRALGTVAADRDGVDVALEVAKHTRSVRVLTEGRPLAKRKLVFADMTAMDVQAAFEVQTDQDGRAPTAWLVHGRRYGVTVLREGRDEPFRIGVFDWADQPELDFAGLERTAGE